VKHEFTLILVGSNPTLENAKDANGNYLPFKGTKSAAVIKEWVSKLGFDFSKVFLTNAYPHPTPKNKAPASREFKKYSPQLFQVCQGHLAIALGEVASAALNLAKVPHLSLPHPSGRNRKLNDPKYLEKKIKDVKKQLKKINDLYGQIYDNRK
jgi:uracil-DNA glycosylase